jgi:hypothetical protein|nr:hypothetical protein [Moraxella osloensis]
MKSIKRPSTTTEPNNQIKLSDLKDTSELVRINLNITKEQRNKLKSYAMQKDKTMTEIITNFIDTLDER